MNLPTDSRDRALVLFPGALGDFLCALPSILALAARHRRGVRLVAQREWLELIGDDRVATMGIERREVAELFASDTPLSDAAHRAFADVCAAHSWTGFGDQNFIRRLSRATHAPTHVHPFRGMRPDEHAIDYYARCIGVAPAKIPLDAIRTDTAASAKLRAQHRLGGAWLLVHAGSGSTAKIWSGFGDLAAGWKREMAAPVVAVAGPAELERQQDLEFADIVIVLPHLPAVAALLAAAPYYAGNDSGISHLAGVMGTRGVVLFGASDPTVWAPRSSRLRVVRGLHECSACGPATFCSHRLRVEEVGAELRKIRLEPHA